MNNREYKLLTELLSQPTAPFREQHVMHVAAQALVRAGVPCFNDPLGNLVIGAGSRSDYLRLIKQTSREPLRVFIAHMDHPGFHGVRWLSANRVQIRWHGGSPVKHLAGARLWLAGESGVLGDGVLRKPVLTKGRWGMATAELVVDRSLFSGERPAAGSLYGGFDFRAPVWRSGQKLYTRAADDLTGVFAIVATALHLYKGKTRRSAPPFLGLLTRAEEVGFVGAIGHFELGWLQQHKRPLVCISLEASRTLPGALIGRGPVVRLGDRRTVFGADGLKVLTDLATRLLPGKHQRRIMDGGSCEGTAATAYGFPVIALSVPLGNYHNQGFEGGPDCQAPQGPAPEFVHLDDIAGELKLCKGLMRPGLAWAAPWRDTRARLQKNLKHYRRLLR